MATSGKTDKSPHDQEIKFFAKVGQSHESLHQLLYWLNFDLNRKEIIWLKWKKTKTKQHLHFFNISRPQTSHSDHRHICTDVSLKLQLHRCVAQAEIKSSDLPLKKHAH